MDGLKAVPFKARLNQRFPREVAFPGVTRAEARKRLETYFPGLKAGASTWP
jgi:hypothetical protein